MLDLTASQAQSSAEHSGPFRQTIFVDTHQGCRVVRHDRHPRLDDRATMAFVGETPSSTAQQAGNDAFHDRSAISTGAGQVHLGGSPDAVQVRRVQHPSDILRCRYQGEGLDGFRDPYGEHPPRMQGVPQGGVIERQIARERMDDRAGTRPDPGDCLFHLVAQGLHIAGITGMAHRQMQGKAEPGRRLSDEARLAAKLGGAVAFALTNGGNGGIVGVDDLAVGQGLALRQAARLVCDPVMCLKGGRELGVQTRALRRRQLGRAVQARLGGPCQRQDRLSQLQQVRLRLAYQRHQHAAHPPALAAEAAHQLCEVLLELLCLPLQ